MLISLDDVLSVVYTWTQNPSASHEKPLVATCHLKLYNFPAKKEDKAFGREEGVGGKSGCLSVSLPKTANILRTTFKRDLLSVPIE